jgi:hypothetical protein
MFAFTLLAAVIALLAPPWLAWREAQHQAYEAEAQQALSYGRAMLRRLDETVQQSLDSMGLLSRFRADRGPVMFVRSSERSEARGQ